MTPATPADKLATAVETLWKWRTADMPSALREAIGKVWAAHRQAQKGSKSRQSEFNSRKPSQKGRCILPHSGAELILSVNEWDGEWYDPDDFVIITTPIWTNKYFSGCEDGTKPCCASRNEKGTDCPTKCSCHD